MLLRIDAGVRVFINTYISYQSLKALKLFPRTSIWDSSRKPYSGNYNKNLNSGP